MIILLSLSHDGRVVTREDQWGEAPILPTEFPYYLIATMGNNPKNIDGPGVF